MLDHHGDLYAAPGETILRRVRAEKATGHSGYNIWRLVRIAPGPFDAPWAESYHDWQPGGWIPEAGEELEDPEPDYAAELYAEDAWLRAAEYNPAHADITARELATHWLNS